MTSVRDILVISVLLFVVGISIYFAADIGHKVNTKLLLNPSINSTPEAVSVINSADAAINLTDYIYLALFISFFIGLVITGWYFGGDSVTAPIYFFIVVLFGFVGVVLQMVWVDISVNPEVSATVASLPITNFILAHLGYFTVVMGLVGIAAMFAKPSQQGGTF
jgi:apolipoprotein N-acyltransferase